MTLSVYITVETLDQNCRIPTRDRTLVVIMMIYNTIKIDYLMKNVTTVNSIVEDSSCSCTGNYSISEYNMIHPLPRF
jgi:hypothetical protein